MLIVIAFLSTAAYLQYNQGLMPCPLCQLQRMVFVSIGFCAFFAWLHNAKQKGTKIYSLLIIILSSAGALLAARQVYIQMQPATPGLNTCGVGIDYLFKTLPFFDALSVVLKGSGACADVSWRFFGFSIPELTFIAFAVLGFIGLTQYLRAKKKKG